MTSEFDAYKYNELGLDALFEGNYEIALQYFNKALSIDPSLVGVIYNRGNIYSVLHSSDQVIADYTLAIEFEPYYYEAYINRGIVYLEQKQDALTAIADFTKAIEIDQSKIQAHFNRANAYSFLGNYNAAIRDISQAIKIEPDNKVTYLNRGYLFFRVRDYHAAVADFSIAIRLDRNFTEAYLNRGDTYKELGQTQASLDDYAAVIELDNVDIESIAAALARRGEILESIGDLAAAFTSYDRATELYPNEHFFQHKRGALLCQLGQLTDALQQERSRDSIG